VAEQEEAFTAGRFKSNRMRFVAEEAERVVPGSESVRMAGDETTGMSVDGDEDDEGDESGEGDTSRVDRSLGDISDEDDFEVLPPRESVGVGGHSGRGRIRTPKRKRSEDP
jgi:hypothetical protein